MFMYYHRTPHEVIFRKVACLFYSEYSKLLYDNIAIMAFDCIILLQFQIHLQDNYSKLNCKIVLSGCHDSRRREEVSEKK